MVTELLIEILKKRKDELSGEDILNIVKAIQIASVIVQQEEIDKIKEAQKKQMELYQKMGEEYMFGGE